MHTKWQMTFFMSLGLMNAGLLLCTAAFMLNRLWERALNYTAAASLAGLLAIICVALGLNSPAGLISLLAKPGAGLSSAVISQAAAAALCAALYFKKARGAAAAAVTAAVSVLILYCMFRLYMISTRAALNTALLFALFAAFAAQFASALAVTDGTGAFRKNSAAALCIIGVNALVFAVFILRIKALTPPDRILSFGQLVSGSLAPVLWGTVIAMFIIPAALSLFAPLKRNFAVNTVFRLSAAAGIFLLSILVNQMPAMSGAIGGRMLF